MLIGVKANTGQHLAFTLNQDEVNGLCYALQEHMSSPIDFLTELRRENVKMRSLGPNEVTDPEGVEHFSESLNKVTEVIHVALLTSAIGVSEKEDIKELLEDAAGDVLLLIDQICLTFKVDLTTSAKATLKAAQQRVKERFKEQIKEALQTQNHEKDV